LELFRFRQPYFQETSFKFAGATSAVKEESWAWKGSQLQKSKPGWHHYYYRKMATIKSTQGKEGLERPPSKDDVIVRKFENSLINLILWLDNCARVCALHNRF